MADNSKKLSRILCGTLALVMLLSATGCNIKKYSTSTEQKLVESGEDETVWVEDGVTSSEYTDVSNVYEAASGSSSSENDSSSSGSSSGGGSTATEDEDFKFENLKRYTQGSEAGYALKTSDYIKSPEVQNQYYLFDDFKIDDGSSGGWSYYLNKNTTLKSVEYYGLGHKGVKMYGDFREWGFNFFMTDEKTAGNGVRTGGGGFDITPTSRRLALQLLKNELFDLYSVNISQPWESCPGHYFWHHYSCEWGTDAICNEIGEVISSIQSHIAFTRGAARQYSLPWSTQFSFWGSDSYINDYTGLKVWGSDSCSYGGHSPSLYRRAFLTTYMGGASHFYPEAGSTINFYNELNEDGVYKLSPVGEMTQDITEFVNNNRDIGISYVPFGLVLDYYHGMYTGRITISQLRAFQVFPYNDGDHMIWNILNSFFPNSWEVHMGGEGNYMVNGPYGDTCDVILQNASQDVLNSYPCLILAGNIELDDAEIKRYKNYVKQGGVLILNTAYLEYFPEYQKLYNGESRHDISVDGGKVIVYGDDFEISELDGIIRDMLAQYVPFTFSEDVEYMVNVKNGSLIVTVINNKGHQYGKSFGEANGGYKIDMSQTIDLKINYTGNLKVKRVTELWSGEALPTGSEVNVTLTPGDASVIEFYFG